MVYDSKLHALAIKRCFGVRQPQVWCFLWWQAWFIVIFMQKPQCGRCWLFVYFLRFVQNFLCYIFHSQTSKDYLTQGNLLKALLLNEKQGNLEKEMYRNIYLYSQYFSPEAGSNVYKPYFYLIKLTEKVFYAFYLLR